MAIIRPVSGLPQERNRSSQNVKHAIQIEVEHALEGRVVGLSDRLATSETADSVRQHIKLSATRHNLIHQGFGALTSRNLRRQSYEVWVVETRP